MNVEQLDGLVVSKAFFMPRTSNIVHVKEKTESTEREDWGKQRDRMVEVSKAFADPVVGD